MGTKTLRGVCTAAGKKAGWRPLPAATTATAASDTEKQDAVIERRGKITSTFHVFCLPTVSTISFCFFYFFILVLTVMLNDQVSEGRKENTLIR